MKLCLVVSADPDTNRRLRGVIRDLGFPCIYMENREEALTACAALMPDIVILDREDDAADGDFVPRLRALKRGANPVVLKCGAEMDGDAMRWMLKESGAQGYLSSPFDRDVIGFKLLQLGLLPQESVH